MYMIVFCDTIYIHYIGSSCGSLGFEEEQPKRESALPIVEHEYSEQDYCVFTEQEYCADFTNFDKIKYYLV